MDPITYQRPADPRIERASTGAWLVKGGGPTRRYSTKLLAVRAMVRRPRPYDLQISQEDPQWATLAARTSRPYIGSGVDFKALLPRPDLSAIRDELLKIPGVISATVCANPDRVEILGTMQIAVTEPPEHGPEGRS